MEKSVIVNLTLDEAKELYKSGNEKLRMLALKIFPEAALDPPSFTQIRSFEDAMAVLGMNIDDENYTVHTLKVRSKAMAAMYKLNIIRKALNLNQDLHFTNDPENSYIYYPYNPIITESSTYYEEELKIGKIEIIGKIKSNGVLYNILGVLADYVFADSFSDFYSDASVAFLGCASKEIAQHFGKYFGILITEAKFGDLDGFEIIEDKYGNA